VRGALGSLGSIFGFLAALAIVLAAIGGPVGFAAWAYRRLRRRWMPAEG
jgi:hypothetical protein